MSFSEQIELLELENTLLNKQYTDLVIDREYVRGKRDETKGATQKGEYALELEKLDAKIAGITANIERNASKINQLRELGDPAKIFSIFSDFWNDCMDKTQPVDDLLARGNELLAIVESITGMESNQSFVRARATLRGMVDGLKARSDEVVRG